MATSRRTVGDLRDYWVDQMAFAHMDPAIPLYETQTWQTSGEDEEGALLYGNTTLMPGLVGDEFFMTRGHWHLKRSRGELCLTLSGEGAVLLMDDARKTWMEPMRPGSTHMIDGRLAHRTVNTGSEPLVFLCVHDSPP